MRKITVKARERHGSRSLDLTIPVDIRNEFKIEVGDVFEIEVVEKNGELIMIAYKRLKPIEQ